VYQRFLSQTQSESAPPWDHFSSYHECFLLKTLRLFPKSTPCRSNLTPSVEECLAPARSFGMKRSSSSSSFAHAFSPNGCVLVDQLVLQRVRHSWVSAMRRPFPPTMVSPLDPCCGDLEALILLAHLPPFLLSLTLVTAGTRSLS